MPKKGYKQTEEHKRKNSEGLKRRWAEEDNSWSNRPRPTLESNRKRSETIRKNYANGYVNPMKGKKLTDEQKRNHVNRSFLGCTHTEETKRIIGKKNSGYRIKDRKLVEKNRRIYKVTLELVRRCVGHKSGKKSHEALGYTKEILINHLESQFEDWMSWDNYGKEWEIDHIKPISTFLKEGITDPAIINALSNLRPLSVTENRRKSNNYIESRESEFRFPLYLRKYLLRIPLDLNGYIVRIPLDLNGYFMRLVI